MPPVTNCASYIDIEAQFVTVKGIEEGCFGTCTDENGNYTLEGLPCETYNIAAGRDFCKQHPYAEQTAFGITIDSMTPGELRFSPTTIGLDPRVRSI